jgi:hypothetical protein
MLFMLAACSTPADHPSGWKPVNYDGLELYVPSSWAVESRAGVGVACLTESSGPPLVVLGSTPIPTEMQLGCYGDSVSSTTRDVVVVERHTPPQGPSQVAQVAAAHLIVGRPETIHGIRGYLFSVVSHSGHSIYGSYSQAGGSFYVYKTGVSVAVSVTDKPLAEAILATIRPSASRT